MTQYEPVIGLEVHVELNTKAKMFCSCSADYFGKQPNSYTCPVCLGLPGALPSINGEAINKCMQIGLSLNCQVADRSLFERKNYFYPDLSKGYQISQYRYPLCVAGWIEVTGDDGRVTKIRINRVHQEEDTGKLTHRGTDTLIDFNRSGVPLVEIVTEPDFKNTSQIRDYAKKLQQLFRYLGVSNADMERGDMRLEANISVRPVGQTELPNYRVELKNINSFRFMVAATEYEIKRQIEALEKGEKLTQETRGWNEDKKSTYLQRSKEEANDYRYFPEPDLPGLNLDSKKAEEIKNSLPELPWDKAKRFEIELGIKKIDAQILSENTEIAEFFQKLIEIGKVNNIPASKIANYIINHKINPKSAKHQAVIDGILSGQTGIISDDSELKALAKKAIDENQKSAGDFKAGKTNAMQALIGGVMSLSKGKADAAKVREILEKLLKP